MIRTANRIAILLAVAAFLAGCQVAKERPEPQVVVRPEEPQPAPQVASADVPPKSQWKVTASGTQEDTFPAENACDGRTDTRWSSDWADPQWLQIDMGEATVVSGLSILWEPAFASKYHVDASLDGAAWKTIYENLTGDGHTDEILLAPTPARFIKIVGTERGTGWGYSIWEVDVRGPSEQVQVTAPSAPGVEAVRLVDGDLKTTWQSAGPAPATIELDFGKPRAFGGARIEWGENHGTEMAMSVSGDGSAWEKVGEVHEGTGRFDLIMHPRKEARFIRIEIAAARQAAPVDIRDIMLRGPDEVLTPVAEYELAAQKANPGLYPQYLLKKQTFWTLVGLPKDSEESILDEYGNLEPKAGSSCIMPYVWLDGGLKSALDASELTQALEDGHLPLPSVTWKLDGVELSVLAMARGALDRSATYARYRVSNTSDQGRQGRLYLAIRPLQVNPPWQYGGFSAIRSLEFAALPEGSAARVNGEALYVSLTPPAGFGARAFDRGDVVEDLQHGRLPEAASLADAGDRISGAFGYDFDLAPGESADVVIACPLHKSTADLAAFAGAASPAEAFEQRLEEARASWRDLLDTVRIELPERAVVDTMKSQIAYILINQDGVAIQPGSRNYKRCWIRDGSMTSSALLKMGLFDEVREYVEWYAARVQTNGWVPPVLNNDGSINTGFGWDNEYDSQGQFVFAVMEYYRFTKDRAFVEKHYDAVKRSLEFLVELRNRTLVPGYMKEEPAPERFAGILPKSISHEGYNPPMHSYWDVFWALKGWKDGRDAARLLGREEEAQWAEEQYQVFRASLLASIEKTIEFKGIDFIPGCAEKGDCDPTSTSIAFAPCAEYAMLPQDALRGSYERYISDLQDRLKPGWFGGFTPYEVRSITAFVKLGQKDRARAVLDFILSYRLPAGWNVLAEVGYSNHRLGSYIGDMPHTWVGSGFVNATRAMLAYEEDDRLVLLAGAPESWVREGSGVVIEGMPTHYGNLDLAARAEGNTLTLDLGGAAAPPAGFDLRWPLAGKPARVLADGVEVTDFDDAGCRVPGGTRRVVAEW